MLREHSLTLVHSPFFLHLSFTFLLKHRAGFCFSENTTKNETPGMLLIVAVNNSSQSASTVEYNFLVNIQLTWNAYG